MTTLYTCTQSNINDNTHTYFLCIFLCGKNRNNNATKYIVLWILVTIVKRKGVPENIRCKVKRSPLWRVALFLQDGMSDWRTGNTHCCVSYVIYNHKISTALWKDVLVLEFSCFHCSEGCAINSTIVFYMYVQHCHHWFVLIIFLSIWHH